MLLGQSETIPISRGKPVLGEWQVRRVTGSFFSFRNALAVPSLLLNVPWKKMTASSFLPHAEYWSQSVMMVDIDGPRDRTVGIQVAGFK